MLKSKETERSEQLNNKDVKNRVKEFKKTTTIRRTTDTSPFLLIPALDRHAKSKRTDDVTKIYPLL